MAVGLTIGTTAWSSEASGGISASYIVSSREGLSKMGALCQKGTAQGSSVADSVAEYSAL
jgi:hypothetical protein